MAKRRKRRGANPAALKALRKKFRLGEFAPKAKRNKASNRPTARRRRRPAPRSMSASSSSMSYDPFSLYG